MKNFNFFEKLWEHSRTLRRVGLVLVMCLITITQMWAVNSAFTPGEILFVNGYSSGNAWGYNACVKAEFSVSGNNAKEVDTHWMFDKDGGKLFYIIVPTDKTTYNKLRLHRYASNCSTNWNYNGDILQSNRSSDAYNMLYSNGTGTDNSGWKSPRETYKFDLYGSTNGWASAIGTMEHVGNGKFFYGFTFTAAAKSYNFKLCDSWGIWWGASSDGKDVTLSGLTVGKEYYIYATMDLATSLNYNNGSNPRSSLQVKALEVHEPGVYESASGYNKSLKTYSGYNYEIYRFAENSSVMHVFAGESLTTNTSDKHNVMQITKTADYSAKNLGWILERGGYSNSTSKGTATDSEFSTVSSSMGMKCHQPAGLAPQSLTLLVKGYDKFRIWAQDKNTTNYLVKVYKNGSDVTTSSNSSLTVREYSLTSDEASLIHIECLGNNDGNGDWILGFSLRVPASCSATQPGVISKGTLSSCSLPLTAAGSPAANNTWYWQSAADGEDKTGTSGATKNVTSTGTYYIRSYCNVGLGCWSDVRSVTVTAADLTPAAPTALTKSSITAKGVTLTVEDVANTNDYEFYVSTSNTAPTSGSTATHSKTDAKSITITNLVAGTQYYAWARAKCGSNKSGWTALTDDKFTTSTVSAAYHLTNVSKTSGAESGIGGSTFTAVFSANTDYSMPTPVVTIGGNAATSGTHYTWNAGTGTITIPANKINGNIVITLNSVPSAPSSAVISGTYHYFPGDNISLTCTPSGNNGPTTYQWYKGGKANGNRIAGATSATYTKNSCAFEDAGSYYCKVTCNATSIWANTNSSENYDVKILRLYVNGSKGGEHYGYVDFVKENATTATASISLGSNWTYGFNMADGCGHYYGNNGTMQYNNCTNWTTNVDGTDCGLTTTNAATYTFTINYSNLGAIVTSVTFPVANQAAGKVIYFDNNVLKWTGSSIYYRIGNSSHSQADQLSLVPGTANLYKMTTREYNNFFAWQIGNAAGGNGSGKSIYNTKNTPAITASIAYEGGAVTAAAVTVTPGEDHSKGGDAQNNNNCEFYSKTITDGMKTDRVTISPYSNGTITVNYTNTSNVASTLTSGNADLAHTVILTSITAVPAEGYEIDDPLTINGSGYAANYVVTDNTTIAASFKLKTYTISYNKGTNGTGSKASETKTHGVNFTLPGSTFTYDGHAQDGWSTSDGGALAYALSGSYTTNAAQEFFPHWKCNTPTITDNGNNTVTITVPSGTMVRYTTDGTDPSSSTGTVYSTTFSIVADCTVKAIAYQSNCTDSEIASQACDYTAPANFQMIANSSAASDATLALNEYIAQGSKNCVTLTGGTAQYQGADGKTMKVNKSNGSGTTQYYGWYFNNSGDKIVVTMTGHILQVGSVISVEGYGANGNGITANTSTSFVNSTGAQQQWSASHTVVAGDTHLVGKNVITFDRYNSCRIFSITISNCQAATPCTTPTLPSLSNQAGCSYSAWNATPSNASTISAAGESISYSWKKGATEKATTASYTPDADGTDYTVTVTVSKAGKITTSVTSSALSATKYGNPTVTGPSSDAEYEVGDVATNLSVTATPDHGESLTYQWYSNTSKSTTTPTPTALENCTTSTYKPSTAAAATTYYFCKVSGGCADVYSSIATVMVNEASCFKVSDATKKSMSDSRPSGTVITDAMINGTITGGTLTYMSRSGGTISGNSSKGLIFDNINDTLVVQLAEGHVFGAGGTITITSCGASASTYGFTVSGNSMTPASLSSGTDVGSGSQSYTITAGDGIAGRSKFNIVRVSTSSINTYLYTINVTGCEDCNEITPSLSYSKSTFWMDDAALTATPTLTGYYGTPTISYASSDPTVVRVDNSSTGAITALKRGTATITATIGATTYSATDYCGNTATCEITVKDVSCGEVVLASATRKSGSGSVMENGTGAYYSASGINSETSGKLGSNGHYMYITLTGTTLQDGDVVVINLNTVGGMGDRAIHLFAGTTSGSTEIGTKASPGTGDNEITLSNVPNNTYSVTMYRTNDNQNHKVDGIKVKRYVCPDSKEFLPTASSGNWNETANWIGSDGRGASLPTIDDRVVISKPVTIDIADAKAKDVLVNQYSGATGKITVSAGKALIIAEKMQKTTTGSNRIATAAADVIINSTRAAGTGALVMGSHDGSNAATVNFQTKVRYDGGFVNQYLGSPFSDETPYVDYEIQLFKFVPAANGSHGWWNKLSYGNTMDPFMGYNQLSNNTSGNYLDLNGRTGHLNASTNVEFTIENGKMYYNSSWPENMFANSWTAPIHIDQFEDDDFVNVNKSIYIFNAGTPEQYAEGGSTMDGGADNEGAGTYSVIPVKSASELEGLGAVTTVIPAMQAFSVMATSSNPSLRLDFNRLVYTPALTDLKIEPTRTPRRAEAEKERPDAMRLRVRGENGWTANAYILGREDFTNGYDDGWDGEYMEGDGSAPQLYSVTNEGYFVVNCIPEIEGTLMAFHPGRADNTYTFSFVYNGNETWYLNDVKEQKSTLISNETTYPFVSNAGDNAARFVISKIPYTTTEITTGVTNLDDETLDVQKVIYNDKMYIIRGGKVFSADGQLVK